MKLKRKLFSKDIAISRDIFITYIGALVGFSNKCKNLHWAAPDKDIHVYLDEFYDILGDFTDTVAESFMGILGKMQPNDIIAVCPEITSATGFINQVLEKTEEFRKAIEENETFAGILSECDDFIKDINKYKYLFSLTNW